MTGNETVRAVLGLSGFVYAFVYIVIALRTVYGGTIARALAHTIFVLTLYWLATIMVAAAIPLLCCPSGDD